MIGKQRKQSLLRQKMDDFKRGPLTGVVWLLAIAGVICLFNHRLHRCEYVGLARGREYRVSPVAGGKIESVLVDLCDEVKQGDIVAKLEDSLLAAQIETAKSAVKQLQAQLEATRLSVSADNADRLVGWKSRLQDFDAREERYRVNALNLKVTLESDRIEAQRLALDAERARKLRDVQTISQQEYDTVRLQHEQVNKRISENTILAARIDKDYREAKARREEFAAQKPAGQVEDSMIAPIREEVRKQELAIDELRIQREAVVLRAPVSGRVMQVLCQVGQAVTPGVPVVVIGERQAMQVVGYVADYDSTQLHEKMQVHISRLSEPGKVAAATITRVGTSIEELPMRLWHDPRKPEYGRCFVVSASEPLGLMPGEKMRIRLAQQGI